MVGSKDWDEMIMSQAPNGRYRSGWDRIYGNNKESVMEYTDCDNCLRLEAENSDLMFQMEELEQQLEVYQSAVEALIAATEGV